MTHHFDFFCLWNDGTRKKIQPLPSSSLLLSFLLSTACIFSPSSDGFLAYRTSTYKLHYFETPTGLKFVMNTDPHTDSLRLVLRQIYVQMYVEYVVRNPLMRFDDTRWDMTTGGFGSTIGGGGSESAGTPVTTSPPGGIGNELFRLAVDRYVRGLPIFD